jgi:PTS system galactitol-specific IIB component
MRGKYDFIANSSPIGDAHGVPAFSAMGLITGLGDEEFLEQVLDLLHKEGK